MDTGRLLAMLGRLSLGTKLLLAPAVAMVCLMLVAGTSYHGLKRQQSTMDSISDLRYTRLQQALEANAFIHEAHFGLVRLLSSPQLENNAIVIAATGEELLSKIASSIDTVGYLSRQEGVDVREAQAVMAAHAAVLNYRDMVTGALAGARQPGGSAGLLLETDSAFELLAWKMATLVSIERRQTADAFAESARRSRQLMLVLAGMVAAAFLAALTVAVVVTRSIRSTVEAIRSAAAELSAGNLTRRAAVPSDDEIGQTARAFNFLVDELARRMGELQHINGQLNDEMVERKAAEKTLRESEDRYRLLIEILPDAILVEREGRISYVNGSALRLFGADRAEDIIGLALRQLVTPELRGPSDEAQPVEGRMRRLDGRQVDIEIRQSVFQHGGETAIQTVVHDITKHKHYEESLRQQAYHDALTGLPNRNCLMDRLEQAIALARRSGAKVYVLFVDLDRFKLINDSLGHDMGDHLLVTVARRMQGCVRQSDTLARLGGDEFVLLLGEARGEDVLGTLIDRLLDVVSQPLTLREQEVSVTCSIGCSSFPEDGDDAVTLLKHADTAMYGAKSEGRNNIKRYRSEMFLRVNEQLLMQTQLRHALERGEFLLHYQPQVDLRSGAVVGAEALIRWRHPVQGLVPPARFIPLAEETGLVVPMGEWVIREACRQARAWLDAGLPQLRLSVNLSALQLELPNLVDTVENVLREHRLPAEYFGLELTEHVSMKDPEKTVEILRKLRAIGVQLSIDDFGTGYSNLAYLKRFPIQRLKLDRSFIQDLADDRADMAVVQGVINIARGLQLEVIAEGVEEEAQAVLLRGYGCDCIQGYWFSRPLPEAEFAQLLAEARVSGP